MALEVATTIEGLVATNPVAGDPVSQADDHLRLLKSVLKATPFIVDRAYGEYTNNADITGTIPLDDTIPQNTEGTQILTASITPKSTTNRLRISVQGQVLSASAPLNIIAAVFSSAGASALAATFVTPPSPDYGVPLVMVHEYVPATTSALTISVRVGTPAGSAIRLNGSSAARLFGGVSKATLVVEEIQAS